MKQKSNDSSDLVTKKILSDELSLFKVGIDITLDEMKIEIDDKARGYRDEILTKLDGVMGELQTIREDAVIGGHHTSKIREQVHDHEKRLKHLEQTTQVA